jgi:hypothetical protein
MAAAKRLAGTCAVFWVVPLSGGILILATYGIGCRLGSRRLGMMAAFLLATSPTFIEFQLVTMTEVPVAAAWTLACWFVFGESRRSAVGAAIAMAVAVLIRPNLVPLGGVIALWVALRIWHGAPHRRRHVARGLIILSGPVAGALGTASIYWMIYGSPFEPGYGPMSNYFALEYVLPNIRSYAQQFVSAQTPFGYLGLAALFIPARRLWPGAGDRSVVLVFGLFVFVVWAEFCFFLASGASLRFLLPCYPFIMIGLSSVGLLIARSGWRGAAPAVAVSVIALGALDFDHGRGAFAQWEEAMYIHIAEQVGRTAPTNSVVMAMQHSGSIRYYAGRVTLRWDLMATDWLDRGVGWLADRGVHTYVLVDGWELKLMKQRFRGQALAAALDNPPAFSMGDTYFFDLGAPAGSTPGTQVIPLELRRGYCPAPAPLPTLTWKTR